MATLTSNPFILLFAQISLLAFTVAFTSPRSPLRIGLFPVSVYLFWKVLQTLRAGWTSNSAVASCLGCTTTSYILQYVVVAVIQGWGVGGGGPVSSKKKGETGVVGRVKFGYEAALTQRHCGTPFQLENLPGFDKKRPGWIPSRTRWILSTIPYLCLAYLILDLISLSNDQEETARSLAPSKIPFLAQLSEVTFEEVTTRFMLVLANWGLGIPVIFLLMRSLAVILVGLGVQRVEQFPPLFHFGEGLPRSVRRFWSHFWHQMMRDKLYLPSKFLCDDILHLPPGLLRRYALILLSFTLSGLVHLAGDYASNMSLSQESGAMRFFVEQAFGIVFEDSMIWLWQRLFGKCKEQRKWQVWVGRVWTAVWLFWSTPIWCYPIARGARGDVVPWSLVRVVRGGLERGRGKGVEG